jgi:hypothetical protein
VSAFVVVDTTLGLLLPRGAPNITAPVGFSAAFVAGTDVWMTPVNVTLAP